MLAVEKSTTDDDPTIEKAYHNIQEGISAAFGMKGPAGLKKHFKKSISLHGFGSDVESSENSRVIVMAIITDTVERTKQELGPTLAKVIISTKDYKSTVSDGTAFVSGHQVIHYKSTGYSRAMASAKGKFQNVGHFFGSFLRGGGRHGEEESDEKANEQENEAVSDSAHELKTELVHFCYKFEKVSDVCEWKVAHMHMDVVENEDTIKTCDECSKASATAS